MKKVIILEIIPTSLDPRKGDVIQLSALKIKDDRIVDRFDYRLNEENIVIKDFLDMVSYDKEIFTYKDSKKEILNAFKKWSKGYTLLYIDNLYTSSYLEYLDNEKESILKHLNMEFDDSIITRIIEKYKLEESNYIVDLLYEALINESNNK